MELELAEICGPRVLDKCWIAAVTLAPPPERRTHDYKRNGTTTLFAALEVATGRVTDACYPRHRHEEFLKFLKQVARNPRIHRHFTPTSGSWMNLVEVFFGIITRH